MKKLTVMAAAMILSIFAFSSSQAPAAAGVPSLGTVLSASFNDGAVIPVMRGGFGHGGFAHGGGFGRGGFGWGGPGFGWGFGVAPLWGWGGWGPVCRLRCGPYRCWRVCW